MATARRSDGVRCAVPDDAPELADVHVTTWRAAYASIFPADFLASLDAGRRERWWRGFLERGECAHVVEIEGRVVGFCHAGASDTQGWGEVFSIYVHPRHWGEGHGRRLLAAGEQTLRREGFGHAVLWVLRDNVRARAFYERQGWHVGRPIRLEEIGGVQVEELRYEIEL